MWYDVVPFPLCRNDDGAVGKIDDHCEKVDARCPKRFEVDGGDTVRPKSLGQLGLDGGGYFTITLMLEPWRCQTVCWSALEVMGGCGVNCQSVSHIFVHPSPAHC